MICEKSDQPIRESEEFPKKIRTLKEEEDEKTLVEIENTAKYLVAFLILLLFGGIIWTRNLNHFEDTVSIVDEFTNQDNHGSTATYF